MLICNNCGTINNSDATTCAHCRINGRFSQAPDPEATVDEMPEKQCQNCGTLIGAHLPKCPECRFPVREAANVKQAGGFVMDKTYVLGSLKAG
jgi:RNA polymerase subunit RPABC4/transcription elongation factor Spt4